MNFNLSTRQNSSGSIWVIADVENEQLSEATFELISEALKLAGSHNKNKRVSVAATGAKKEKILSGLKRIKGLSKIFYSELETNFFEEEKYAAIFAEMAKKYHPDIILGSASTRGRALMPRLAVLLRTGLTADCTHLEICSETGNLIQTRPAFGGNLLASIMCETIPRMATVRPRVFKNDLVMTEKENPEIIEFPVPGNIKSLKRLLRQEGFERDSENLSNSEVIVAAGMGSGGPDGVKLIKALANKLNAGLAGSRPVVDRGWLEYPHQVGQTGITVHPQMYIACGISGAVQHLTGMSGSEFILAINNDPDAPIFKIADVGIKGDIKNVIPSLLQAL